MNARGALRLAGLALSLVAVAWILVRCGRSGALDVLRDAPIGSLGLVVLAIVAAIAYALAMLLPGCAWWRLMAALAASPPPALPIVATYAISQYGKYLPGNVAHYALRHAWSRRYGLSHAALGLASVLEAALLVLAALALTFVADAPRVGFLSTFDPRLAPGIVVVLLVLLGGALALARRSTLLARFPIPMLPSAATLATCLALYATFLLACASLIDGLAHALRIPIESFAVLLGAAAASWLAGFVVIGAPGGLGVREAAFVALTGAALGESRALVLIGAFRVVTFLGDTFLFAAGVLAMRRTPRAD